MCVGSDDCDCHFGDEDEDFDEDDPIEDDDCDQIDGVGFAEPGGRSALRAETADNPRDCSCPTCGRRNVLTRIDVQRGYQCNSCSDLDERGF